MLSGTSFNNSAPLPPSSWTNRLALAAVVLGLGGGVWKGVEFGEEIHKGNQAEAAMQIKESNLHEVRNQISENFTKDLKTWVEGKGKSWLKDIGIENVEPATYDQQYLHRNDKSVIDLIDSGETPLVFLKQLEEDEINAMKSIQVLANDKKPGSKDLITKLEKQYEKENGLQDYSLISPMTLTQQARAKGLGPVDLLKELVKISRVYTDINKQVPGDPDRSFLSLMHLSQNH